VSECVCEREKGPDVWNRGGAREEESGEGVREEETRQLAEVDDRGRERLLRAPKGSQRDAD